LLVVVLPWPIPAAERVFKLKSDLCLFSTPWRGLSCLQAECWHEVQQRRANKQQQQQQLQQQVGEFV
jgi:hypothetical protein